MQDDDLMDLMRAITHLWAGVEALGAGLPPEQASRLQAVKEGVSTALTAILDRHDISTTEADDGPARAPAP